MKTPVWPTALALVAMAAVTHAADTPYDAMWQSYGVRLDPADGEAWLNKVRAIARDEFHFWRGTRDLFYAWCGDHCRDWQSDSAAVVVCQGDLHLGNVGSYAAAGEFGDVAYGLVDFDDSARLPFQVELLQAIVTFELIARENAIAFSPADHAALHTAIFDAYAAALARPPVETGLAAMVKSNAGRPYQTEVDEFTRDDRFRSAVDKKGVVTDRLRPPDAAVRAGIAGALAEAVQHDARLAARLRPYDAADFDACLLDVAERVRLDSSGSQGLSKLLVLLRRPFRDHDGDGLLYLKQQVPSAAERAGFVAPEPGPPGRRCVRDLDALTHGRALAASWCDLAGRSYWVSVKEPWSDEPSAKAIRDVDQLLEAARVVARVIAESHSDAALRLRPLLTPAVRATIVARAEAYLVRQRAAFADFRADERVVEITR